MLKGSLSTQVVRTSGSGAGEGKREGVVGEGGWRGKVEVPGGNKSVDGKVGEKKLFYSRPAPLLISKNFNPRGRKSLEAPVWWELRRRGRWRLLGLLLWLLLRANRGPSFLFRLVGAPFCKLGPCHSLLGGGGGAVCQKSRGGPPPREA